MSLTLKKITLNGIHPAFAVFLVIAFPINGNTKDLTIATHQYTSNWNAVSYTTYPASITTKATHEALFIEKCIGAAANEGKSSFQKICLDKSF